MRIVSYPLALTNHACLVGVSLLLFLPSALFAFSLRPLPAFLVLAGCVGGLAIIALHLSPEGLLRAPFQMRHWAAYCGFAFALLVLGGEGHLFYANSDWLTRDAVLADLVRGGALSSYRFGDADTLLRAPLGMYMLPAQAGRAFGLGAAHGALLAQNTLFLGTILYLIATLGNGRWMIAILVFFAGVSIIGAAMRTAWSPSSSATPLWLQWGLDGWHPLYLQYSGTLVQFFWVPNHALPAWWLALLMLLQVRGQVDVATLGVSVAGALLWSPLSIVPVVPWLLFSALCRPRAVLWSARTVLGGLAAVCFVPIAIYLVLASGTIDGGSQSGRPDFSFWYGLFVVIQLPVLAYLAFARAHIMKQDRALVVVCASILLLLPLFRFGPNNDLVMRASIVPLVIVAFTFGYIVLEETRRRTALAVAGWALVAASVPSAAVEIGRALATPRYAISACSLADASHALDGGAVPTNYVVPFAQVPAWLIDVSRASAVATTDGSCWPDRTLPRYFGLETVGARPER